MALSHLVDTSVLTRLSRPAVRDVVEPMALAGRLGRPSICDLEVGYAARNAEEWDSLLGALNAFEPVETSAAHVTRALQVQRLLAARSQRRPQATRSASGRRSRSVASFGAPLRHRLRTHQRRHRSSPPMGATGRHRRLV